MEQPDNPQVPLKTRTGDTECLTLLAETITITGHNGETIEAYSARALDYAPRGGVVVIHHMPGYDIQTKEIARNFAAHGYNAVVPNLYWREAPARARTTRPRRPAPRAASPTSAWSATWPAPWPTSRA